MKKSLSWDLYGGCRIKLENIMMLPNKIISYKATKTNMWDDTYISKILLSDHLDKYSEKTTRRIVDIKKEVNKICSLTNLIKDSSLLDLGCGIGLYCEMFSKKGIVVTGIDFSRRTINYAVKQALDKGLKIKYKYKNYLKDDFSKKYDIITLIFGGFCNIPNNERDNFLSNIYRSLKPTGYFVFDVTTNNHFKNRPSGNEWYVVRKNGFWMKNTHLVLKQTKKYKNNDVFLSRFNIINEYSKIKTYDIWHQNYSINSIKCLLKKHRFKIDKYYSNLSGKAYTKNSEWIGIFSRKVKG